jgi:hypothetical protein
MVLLLHGPDMRPRNDRRSAKGYEYGYSRDIRLVSGFWEVDELDSGELEVVMECSILEFSGRAGSMT